MHHEQGAEGCVWVISAQNPQYPYRHNNRSHQASECCTVRDGWVLPPLFVCTLCICNHPGGHHGCDASGQRRFRRESNGNGETSARSGPREPEKVLQLLLPDTRLVDRSRYRNRSTSSPP